MNENWVPFRFDGNQYFGEITTPEKWEEVLAIYDNIWCNGNKDLMDKTLRGSNRAHPNFGLRDGYNGPETLREFFEKNNMTCSVMVQV